MDILTSIAVELPCEECGGKFRVSLGQILLAQEGMRSACDALGERECPGFYYAGLIEAGLAEQLVDVWDQIASRAHALGGELIVVTDTESA
ncbi:MAG TPA: hypothetical protein VJQ83_02500 [Tepidiformaceae bacterium]|nr:hypothetical protein [Tepidiformaceae bacterium]